jgi:heat shock protein HslJ
LDAEGFQGSAGCNRYGGEYQAAAGGVFVPDNVWQTEKECPAPDLQKQEQAYLQALRSATAYRLAGDHLEIQDSAGETVLAFARKGGFSIDPALEGGEWVLTSLKDATPLSGTQILLAFSDGQAGGFAGCNSYGGAITAADEGVLAIGEIGMTAQGCLEPAGVLEQEEAYIEALTAAAAYGVGEDRLEIFDTEGHAILTFDRKAEFAMDPGDLLGTRWQLVSMADASPAEGSRITLIFQSGDRLSGEAGCRGYVASYQAAGDDIRFPEIGMTGPTGPCSDALLLQEGQYTTHLELVTNYRLGEGALEFFTAQGKLLLYEPLPADADAALEGTPWTLADMIERRDVEGIGAPHSLPTGLWAGTEITAAFDDGQVRGSAGCNSYGGAYTLEGSELRLGSLEATEMWCAEPEGVMDQEQRYLDLLREANRYRIDGNQLWLDSGGGQALIFDAGKDSTDCISAGVLPPEDAELVWPALLEASPNPVAPGQAVEVRATGGYLIWETPCGTAVQESARSFAMAFDGDPVGSLDCYANTCLATLTIPSDLPPGEHTLSVEGGSNLIIVVGDG